MKIDNAEYDGKTITTRIHGYTFTHSEDCGIKKVWTRQADVQNSCDCFLSRVDITEINGVPVGSVRQRWWEKPPVIFGFGYITCGIASFVGRMFLGGQP